MDKLGDLGGRTYRQTDRLESQDTYYTSSPHFFCEDYLFDLCDMFFYNGGIKDDTNN